MNYLNINTLKKINEIQENILLYENIFDLSTYTKEHKEELKQAINEMTKLAIEKYDKIFNYLYKKNKRFYEALNVDPIYVYDGSNKKVLEIMTNAIKFSYDQNVNQKEVKKFIYESSPFEFSVDLSLQNKKTGEKIKGKIVFVCVLENTFLNRLYRVKNYSYITSSLFNHPLWSKIEFLIFLLHELIEAEEEIIDNRRQHYSGKIFLEYRNKNFSIANHHSIIVLAKEAVILNKYKNIKALRKLREARYTEWKTIKTLTGVDLSTLTELDNNTIKKLLKIKKSKIQLKDETIEGVKEKYDNIKDTEIQGFLTKIIKKFDSKSNSNKLPKFIDFKNLK